MTEYGGDWQRRNPFLGTSDMMSEHLVLHKLADVAQNLGGKALETVSSAYNKLLTTGGAILNVVQKQTEIS